MTREQEVRASIAASMSVAASNFLASLRPTQLATSAWAFPSDEERRRWFYTPTDHGGLTLQEMTPTQRSRAFALLATGLSEGGYVTVSTLIGLENVLDRVGGHQPGFGYERARDPGRYFLRIFGDPSKRDWGWRFGGHHISINNTIVHGMLASGTPSFLGADPATSPLLGSYMLRPLGGLQDTAFDLLGKLDPIQLAEAIVSPVPPIDTVGGNRSSLDIGATSIEPRRLSEVFRERFGEPFNQELERTQDESERHLGLTTDHRKALRFSATPIGLVASKMNRIQRDTLTSLLRQYVGRLPDALAELEMQKVVGDRFEGLHFAWAGGTQTGVPHYYRIQGEDLVMEYDNTQRDANHIHSVWRDPKGDFGTDLLALHYANGHPHSH